MKRKRLSDVILELYRQKKKKNSKFSMRSFARFLTISPATLHAILNEKTSVTDSTLQRISKKLNLSGEESAYFQNLSKAKRARAIDRKEQYLKDASHADTRFDSLTDEEFRAIASWHCLALIELCRLKEARADVHWISRKLGISQIEAATGIGILLKLKFIQINSGGRIEMLRDFVALPSGPRMPEATHIYGQFVDKAAVAIKEQPKGTRNFSTLVLKFRKSDLPEVDETIRKFRREFNSKFGNDDGHDSVYALAVQFFRLDRD